MHLEAVIVCQNYSDFLAETLPENLPYLDHVVVVTGHDDKATQDLCRRYSIDCVKTDCFTEHGNSFNKGRAINLGLGHLRGLDWILHLDADVVLPHRFKALLDRAQLKPQNLYGADRILIHGSEQWDQHRGKHVPFHADGYFVEPPWGLHVGARIIHQQMGYTPIGYFQLWHKSQGKQYPVNQGNAEHTDVLFAAQWAREHRVLLPDVFVYHLESEHAPMGANWSGRRTKPFRENHHRHHHGQPSDPPAVQPYIPKK